MLRVLWVLVLLAAPPARAEDTPGQSPDEPGVEFHLAHGEMFRVLRDAGFEVEDLVELYAPAGATTSYPFVTAEWSQQWPMEEAWIARRR